MSKEECLCKNKSLILKKLGRQVKCCAGLRWFYFVAGMAAGYRADKIGRNHLSVRLGHPSVRLGHPSTLKHFIMTSG